MNLKEDFNFHSNKLGYTAAIMAVLGVVIAIKLGMHLYPGKFAVILWMIFPTMFIPSMLVGETKLTQAGFAVEHGIGVALGMISAERFGTATGLGVAAPELVAHAELLAKRGAGLSEAAAGFDRSVFERSFLADKKHGPDGLHLILPSASGSVAEVVAERSDEVVAAATGSVEAVLDIVTS